MRKFVFVTQVLAATFVLTAGASAAEISGAGASFPRAIYAEWAAAYGSETGNAIKYQATNSGEGIKRIQTKSVTFGATDMPLQGSDLDTKELIQFPTVLGAVVPVVNLAGVRRRVLVLDGATLAKIFLGEIKTWNDAAIAHLNPGVALPSSEITVVHRSDAAGTSFVWTDYLSKVSADWKTKVGTGLMVKWPVGVDVESTAELAEKVMQTRNSIGYLEYDYAKLSRVVYTRMVNKDGKTVEPGAAAVEAAAANAEWSDAPGFGADLTDRPGAASWPVTTLTFVLMQRKPAQGAASAEALKFFAWCYANGGKMAAALDYGAMPANVVAQIEKAWADVVGADGKPVFVPSL